MAYTGTSIVDYLNSVGKSSSFSDRAKMAAAAGITNYKGTAAQNTQLLNQMKAASAAPPTTASTPKPVAAATTPTASTKPATVTPTAPAAPSGMVQTMKAQNTAASTPISGAVNAAKTFVSGIANAVTGTKPAATPTGVSSPTSPMVSGTPAKAPSVSGKAASGYTIPAGFTDVASLQRQLNTMGANLRVDNVYGKDTDAALTKLMPGTKSGKITTLPGTPGAASTLTKLPGTSGTQTPTKLGSVATPQAAPTVVKAAAPATSENPTLRAAAQALGYDVGWDAATGQVTVKDPKTGKSFSFAANEGEQFGIGDATSGSHTVTDPELFAQSMQGAAAAAAEEQGVDLNDPEQLQQFLADFVKEYVDTTTEEDLAVANETFQSMLQMFGMDTSAVQVPDILSFDQAKQQAEQMYDPLYDEQSERLQKQLQEAAVRSGFAGQMPWTAFEMENKTALERQRTGDIANAAQTLVGQSKTDAQNALSQAASKRQELFNIFNSALNQSAANKTGKFDILKNWMSTLGQAQTTKLANQKTEQELDAYNKYEIPMLSAKARAAESDAQKAEIDLLLKEAELAVVDEKQKLTLEKLRQDIKLAKNADARAAALNKWQVTAAEYGVSLDATKLENELNTAATASYTTAANDLMEKIRMGSTDVSGTFVPRYSRGNLMMVIAGYPGLTSEERDRLLFMIPTYVQ